MATKDSKQNVIACETDFTNKKYGCFEHIYNKDTVFFLESEADVSC